MSFVDNVSNLSARTVSTGVYVDSTRSSRWAAPIRAVGQPPHHHQPVRFRRRYSNALLGVFRPIRKAPSASMAIRSRRPGILRSGQLAREQALDPRPRHALLSPAPADRHQPDHLSPALYSRAERPHAVHADNRSERQARRGRFPHRRPICQCQRIRAFIPDRHGIERRSHRRPERLPGRPLYYRSDVPRPASASPGMSSAPAKPPFAAAPACSRITCRARP